MKKHITTKIVAIFSLLLVWAFAVTASAQVPPVRFPAPNPCPSFPVPVDPYTTPGSPANPNGPPPLRNPGGNNQNCYSCSLPTATSCWWDQSAPANPTPVPPAPTKTRPAGVSCVICQITVTMSAGNAALAACAGLPNPQNFVHRSCDTSTPPAVPKTYDQLADQAKRRAQAICNNTGLPSDWCPAPPAPGGPGGPAAPAGPRVNSFVTSCLSSDPQASGLCRTCTVKAADEKIVANAGMSSMSESAEVCAANLTIKVKDQQAISTAIQKLEAKK